MRTSCLGPWPGSAITTNTRTAQRPSPAAASTIARTMRPEPGRGPRQLNERSQSWRSPNEEIMPCLWFDTEAENAAIFYCSVFKNSRITEISRYGNEGFEKHGKRAGSVMVAAFELEGAEIRGAQRR